MNLANPGETCVGGLARNMSAPPRSSISFRPYRSEAALPGVAATNGLCWRLRADPDALIRAHRPGLNRRMGALRRQIQACAEDQPRSAALTAELRLLRLSGVLDLAASLTGTASDLPADVPLETLLDRLADLSRTLPQANLPAMGIVDPVTPEAHRKPPAEDLLAALWVLTHLNGRTFDRDGLPLLAPGLEDGRAYDLYIR
jgi:hypothetical protein